MSLGHSFVLIHASGAIAVVGLELFWCEGIFFLVKGCILVLEHPPYVLTKTGVVKILLHPRKAEVQQFGKDSKTAH